MQDGIQMKHVPRNGILRQVLWTEIWNCMQNGMRLKYRKPVIDTAELQKLVDEMDRVDLEKYEKDAAYDAFVAALQNAKAVLTDPESEQAVAEAKAALTEAYANLKLIEMPESQPNTGT